MLGALALPPNQEKQAMESLRTKPVEKTAEDTGGSAMPQHYGKIVCGVTGAVNVLREAYSTGPIAPPAFGTIRTRTAG